ncbi:unnamed protein product [Rhodiola kirilowii]
MSSTVHIITRSPPGYSPLDGKSFSRSGFSRRAAGSPCTSIAYYRKLSLTEVESFKCTPRKALVCRASSSGQKRNSDFSRQNKPGFSWNRNRQNEERYNLENLEESEPISSKNGSLLSLSDTPKYQATAAPGPREKEIVELFRKVQAQLRERAAIKEEKKIEALQGKGKEKENETVDSLLKLLRKHSVEQGKRSQTNIGSGDLINNRSEPNGLLNGNKSSSFLKSASPAEEPKPHNASASRRPVSNFRKNSPVPKVKFQPVYTRPIAAESVPQLKKESKIETRPDDLDFELEPELDHEPETDISSLLSKMTILNEAASSDEDNDELETEEDESEIEDENKEESVKDIDFASLKLIELRALAKARGMKRFSKLKKGELAELLSRNST